MKQETSDDHRKEAPVIWDCGSPLYDSFELASVSHFIERRMMALPLSSSSSSSTTTSIQSSYSSSTTSTSSSSSSSSRIESYKIKDRRSTSRLSASSSSATTHETEVRYSASSSPWKDSWGRLGCKRKEERGTGQSSMVTNKRRKKVARCFGFLPGLGFFKK